MKHTFAFAALLAASHSVHSQTPAPLPAICTDPGLSEAAFTSFSKRKGYEAPLAAVYAASPDTHGNPVQRVEFVDVCKGVETARNSTPENGIKSYSEAFPNALCYLGNARFSYDKGVVCPAVAEDRKAPERQIPKAENDSLACGQKTLRTIFASDVPAIQGATWLQSPNGFLTIRNGGVEEVTEGPVMLYQRENRTVQIYRPGHLAAEGQSDLQLSTPASLRVCVIR